MSLVTLRDGGAALVVDAGGPGVPRVVHWGADVADAEAVALAAQRPVARAALDVPVAPSLLPEAAVGWRGRPGPSPWAPGAPPALALPPLAAGGPPPALPVRAG